MEFASEMVVRAALARLVIGEVPTTLAVDGRSRPPHLRTWSDAGAPAVPADVQPRWLFLYPGAMLGRLGLVATLSACGALVLGRIGLDYHTFLVPPSHLVGVQVVGFGVMPAIFATANGLFRGRGCSCADAGWSRWRCLMVALDVVCAPRRRRMVDVAVAAGRFRSADLAAVMRVLTLSLVLIATGVQTRLHLFLLASSTFRCAQRRARLKHGRGL